MAPHLTQTYVDRAVFSKEGRGSDIRRDDEVRGLGLILHPAGRKSWVLEYSYYGQRKRMVLGRHPEVTLAEARQKARQALVQVGEGKDPAIERRRGEVPTLEEFRAIYLDRHARPRKKSVRDDERRFTLHFKRFDRMPLNAITRDLVARWHHDIGVTAPYEANRCLALLSKVYNLGIVWGYIPEPASNPCYGVEKFAEKRRDRWVTPEEMPKLHAAICDYPDARIRAAVWLYLLTGFRRSELLSLQWQWVNFARAEIRIPDTKAGRPFVAPLSPAAVTVLQSLLPARNGFVFHGRGKTGHITELKSAWRKILTRADIDGVRIHDLRRTVGSWLAQSGASLHAIGAVLNQTQASTTQRYAWIADQSKRKLLDQHDQEFRRIVGDDWLTSMRSPLASRAEINMEKVCVLADSGEAHLEGEHG